MRDSRFLLQCSRNTDRIPSTSLPTHADKLVENNLLALRAGVLSFRSLDQQGGQYLRIERKWAFDALEAENRITTAGHLLSRLEQTKLWNTHPYLLDSTWQTNQQKPLKVLKEQDHKGKPTDKFLEALKKPSQMKQVQKEFLAVEKQLRHEPRRAVP